MITYIVRFSTPNLMDMMSLDVAKILHGQVWRLVTWVIYPPSTGNFLLFVISILFFYYPIGTSLERTWGAFRYTLYIFSGLFGKMNPPARNVRNISFLTGRSPPRYLPRSKAV